MEMGAVSSLIFTELTPTEAVRQARQAVSNGQEEAWEVLDRTLRWRLVAHLKDRSVDPDEIEAALLEAAHWARRKDQSPWCHLWPYLLEILEAAEHQPGVAQDLEAIEGRAAELLAFMLRHGKPVRPSDLCGWTGLSKQQVSTLGRKLEEADLIVRRSGEGRATWFFATPRARKMEPLLPRSRPSAEPPPAEQESGLRVWSAEAIGEPVTIQ